MMQKSRSALQNATLTTQQRNQEEEDTVLTLELRPRRRIQWDSNVVDNEHKNRKKSKSTCATQFFRCELFFSFFINDTHTHTTYQSVEYFIRRSHLVRVHLKKRIFLQMNRWTVMMKRSIIVVIIMTISIKRIKVVVISIIVTAVIINTTANVIIIIIPKRSSQL